MVGACLCGATAAAALRNEGFDGGIVLIGMEDEPPYERPPLSKEYLRGEQPVDRFLVRPADWFEQNDVELRTGTRVVQLDPRSREVVLAGGERVGFGSLLVATGSRNRKLDVPGVHLPGVFDLRVLDE